MTKEDVLKFFKDEVIPALCPGAEQVWNRHRWTRDRKIIRVLLRLPLTYKMFREVYPSVVSGVVKKEAVEGLMKPDEVGGELSSIIPYDAEAFALAAIDGGAKFQIYNLYINI